MYLLRFTYGEWRLIPVCNEQGEGAKEREEPFVYKRRTQAEAVLARLQRKGKR